MKFYHLTVTLLLFLISNLSFSQNEEGVKLKHNSAFGISVQVYPSGIIPTINYEYYLTDKSSLQYCLGVNIIDRQDYSDKNDEEKGVGFGGSFGYRYHFVKPKGAFIIGVNLDVWNTWIDWRNNVNEMGQTSGNTYIFVLQPWLEVGYFFNLKNTSKLGITGGFGREINVITNGKDVAQGWIGSLSIQYYFANRKL